MAKSSKRGRTQETDVVSQPERSETDAAKAASATPEAASSKKKKAKVTQTVPGQSLFTKKDEKFLLKAMAEKKTRAEVYESVKDVLSAEFTKEQVTEKVKRLKSKRYNSSSKSNNNTFKQGLALEAELIERVSLVGVSESLLIEGLEAIDPATRAEVNHRWAKIASAEMQLSSEKRKLFVDLTKLVSDALK